MIAKLKKFSLQVVAGANAVTILLMLLVGYSGHIDPTNHPTLANVGLLFPAFIAINAAFLFFWVVFKLKGVVIPFVGYILCYGPMRTYIPANIPHDPPVGAIKLLSYNTQNYHSMKPYVDTFSNDSIAAYILQSGADIVCVQEGGHALDFDSTFRAKYPYIMEEKKKGGSDVVALYSRFPILRSQLIDYESEGNMSVGFYLNVNGEKVLIVNNHLESNGLDNDDKSGFGNLIKGDLDKDMARAESSRLIDKLAAASKKRAPQAEAVARYIANHRTGHRVIVCGDFNENPLGYAHKRIGEDLTDCYAATANGIGRTYNQSHMYVRIDHLFCSDDITPYACAVDNQIKASDHYPIYCWLKFGRKI